MSEVIKNSSARDRSVYLKNFVNDELHGEVLDKVMKT